MPWDWPAPDLAITQAICVYRRFNEIDGPLYRLCCVAGVTVIGEAGGMTG
jgi:hypothetical protein